MKIFPRYSDPLLPFITSPPIRLRSTPAGCYSKNMEKTKRRWDPEVTTAAQMKEIVSSRKSQKTPRSPKTKRNARYWDEGRVLKVGFLLVFVRAFARLLLKGLGKFTPVVAFLFFIILGGLTTSTLETLQRGSQGTQMPQTEVLRGS